MMCHMQDQIFQDEMRKWAENGVGSISGDENIFVFLLYSGILLGLDFEVLS